MYDTRPEGDPIPEKESKKMMKHTYDNPLTFLKRIQTPKNEVNKRKQ